MTDIIRHKDKYYILATSTQATGQTRTLKCGEMFAVFDPLGDIHDLRRGEYGIFYRGTRYLSYLHFLFLGRSPSLLSSVTKEDNAMLVEDLTNPDLEVDGQLIPRGVFHIFRSKFLYDGTCYERLRIRNYGLTRIPISFSLEFDSDFYDVFEIRGMKRAKRGELKPVQEKERALSLSYEGLDRVVRTTQVLFDPAPTTVEGKMSTFEAVLSPKQSVDFTIRVVCMEKKRRKKALDWAQARERTLNEMKAGWQESPVIYSSNGPFNRWVNQSLMDLKMMTTRTSEGFYPFAGIPWFSTTFGRDGVITALQVLWMNPQIAKGVLKFLAKTQSTKEDSQSDAQPGKILHEARTGEMAALGEIPFKKYYGSVDSTPLFLILVGAYLERTGDLGFVRRLWPNVKSALRWIDLHGDQDGDGFVEYQRQTPRGLVHQGWKDSFDAVFHSDGALAAGPIALCEVQAYVYAAKRAASAIARTLGHFKLAEALRRDSLALQRKFESYFWDSKLGVYVLALDGKKKPCRVRSSNAGQVLFTGIASAENGTRVVEQMLSSDFFNGWGVRTLARNEARYNPMSYHNGSVWPHDTALIAKGFGGYGRRDAVEPLLHGLMDASMLLDRNRLPELFCGFTRRYGQPPTRYPLACEPQAWASGSVFMLLESMLGIEFDVESKRMKMIRPHLPEWMQTLHIQGLRLWGGRVDIKLERRPARSVSVEVEGDADRVAILA
jgi:glycogen debranching enzyme